MMSKTTLELLNESGRIIKQDMKKEKYSKRLITLSSGYDFLETLIIVRPYIQQKYNMGVSFLEILLYLHGKKFFCQADFGELTKQFTYGSLKNLLDTGYISMVQEGVDMSKHVFKLNTQATHIVQEFYELLSGERKFPEGWENPLDRKKTRTLSDKKRMTLIKKMNLLPAPEKKKPLYL